MTSGRRGRDRVITFDNAGVGKSASPPMSLTIDAMADQASASTWLFWGRAAGLGSAGLRSAITRGTR